MTNTEAFQSFGALPIPKKELTVGTAGYRVYKDIDNFVTVQAQTALEALQASGLAMAYKIERDAMDYNKVVQPQAWAQKAAAASPEAAQPPAATATEEKPASPPAGSEAAPLSGDDVNNLLKKPA